MIRLLWRFGWLIVIVAAFVWLADRPGLVAMRWMGWEIETSVVVMAAALLGFTALLFLLWSFLRWIWRSPRTISTYLGLRREEQGYRSLSRGLIAAAAGDAEEAGRQASRASKSLKNEPLVQLLAAQAAQLRGESQDVRRLFQAMAKQKDTEALGLRGLFTTAITAGETEAALSLAQRAYEGNSRLSWAGSALLQLEARKGNWQQADKLLQEQARTGSITAAEAGFKRAAVLAALAMEQEAGEPNTAIATAKIAHKLDPSLVPAATVLARLFIRQGSPRKASHVLEKTWRLSPHPDLAEIMAHLKPGASPEQRYLRVRDLVTYAAPSLEADIALARAAIAAQDWEVARKILGPYSQNRPEVRICIMLAEIEEAAGDKGRARQWLSRALQAPREPMWMSDGLVLPRWSPVSPVTAEIIPCLWKRPFDVQDDEGELAAPETDRSDALPPVSDPPASELLPPSPPLSSNATPVVMPPLPDDPGPLGNSDQRTEARPPPDWNG